ncbi:MAG: hypothetical protein JWM88_2265 [Verrucomicrobia bacterium]|nr:hypothetical protein [Verrucomicrobiota bacterium]
MKLAGVFSSVVAKFLSKAPAFAFSFAVAAFAWLRFSDNTADNDLWGHVLYGQRMLALGHLEKADPFSWTAAGAPWINHEVLAEIALGAVHRAAGGNGLWLLAVAVAGLTLVIALRAGRRTAPEKGIGLVQAALLAASTNGIAMGFSVRPQLFTMLALVIWLGQMRALERGARWPLAALPLLALNWINTHGGVLAALVLLGLAAAVTLVVAWLPGQGADRIFLRPPRGLGARFAAAFGLCLASSLVTPWGPASLRWLIESVGFPRPEITEWRPTPFDFSHAAFWVAAAISLIAWIASRRGRSAWEAATVVLLLAMAWRHQRHIPLFLLANLVLTPPHLLDLFRRIGPQVSRLRSSLQNAVVRGVAVLALIAAGAAAMAASFSPPKENPWTIEIERDLFPCAALDFLRDHPLPGNLLVFFDWGQQAMWELPQNPVSFDGRFDTVYPRAVIEAHWRFYRGENPDPSVLDLRRADVALLPSAGAGGELLLKSGWTLVYSDPLASVWVRALPAHPSLEGLPLPIRENGAATEGREDFPQESSPRAGPENF